MASHESPEGARQRQDVLATIPQRWQVDREDVAPVVEVLAKLAGGDVASWGFMNASSRSGQAEVPSVLEDQNLRLPDVES